MHLSEDCLKVVVEALAVRAGAVHRVVIVQVQYLRAQVRESHHVFSAAQLHGMG